MSPTLEERESDIKEKIYSFFPAESLSYFPANAVENLISSELMYEHMLEGEHMDGMGVMLGYQKVLDGMVELYISKPFRKFIKKNSLSPHGSQDPLDSSIERVIEKKYILSLGRLYGILVMIHSGNNISENVQKFNSFLKSRPFLKKALLESDFLLQLQKIEHLHILSDKRHSGTLSLENTRIAREMIIGGFKNNDCILMHLANSQVHNI